MKNKKNQKSAIKFFFFIVIIASISIFNFTGCKIMANTNNNISNNSNQTNDSSENNQTMESNPLISINSETTYAILESGSETGNESAKHGDEANENNPNESTAAKSEPLSQDLLDNMENISKNPIAMSSFETKGVPSNFIIKDNFAFITWGYVDTKANSFGGLSIIDITNKKNPLSLAVVDLKGIPFDMIIDKNYCYILWGKEDTNGKQNGGLNIINISNKNKPESLSELSFETIPLKMYTVEDYIYIVYQTHLSVIDVRNKEIPEIINSFNPNNSLKHVFMTQDYQYLITEKITQNENDEKTVKSTLEIIEVNDIRNFVSVGNIGFNGSIYDVSIEKDFAFVLCENELKILNIKNKNTPAVVGTVKVSGNYLNINGETAFIGSSLGISTVDLINKENPQKKSFYTSAHLISNIEIFGKYLYSTWVDRDNNNNFSSVNSGVEIFDTSASNNTSIVENLSIQNYILNIYKEQNYLFIAWGTMERDYNRTGGITIVELY